MTTDFPATSRYVTIPTATHDVDGRTTRYLTRRFLPQPEELALLHTHTVAEGERLDNVTARYLGDPEQFWRIADANRALRPDDLLAVVGRELRITLPAGFPGARDA
ncbi:LysM peptidoglycan-binding domain-containing protein [Nocardia sp. XZ_19_231]|uniref:LysM peptidoglycan-binding domain-containing protein n=1 Tax=Nocardia sp. XZ_19_231 TaxID=2769252 RepID=UPI0018906A77|nr:LysM peptidoglycan-binding domain-containing protein [Nocardia sp. XZ_19_231]